MNCKLSILITENCKDVLPALQRILPGLFLTVSTRLIAAEELQNAFREQNPDALILSGQDYDFTAGLSEQPYTAILLIASRDELIRMRPACVAGGILAGSKEDLNNMLLQLLAVCVRLRSSRQRASSLQRKLDDTRLVNRAKLLLMTRLKMSEAEAHRYIEKTAMDSSQRLGDVAMGIIRTYDD